MFLDSDYMHQASMKLSNFISFAHEHKIPLTRELVYKTLRGLNNKEIFRYDEHEMGNNQLNKKTSANVNEDTQQSSEPLQI